jgi:hypothetical protein
LAATLVTRNVSPRGDYTCVAGFGSFIAVGQPGEEIDFCGVARPYYAGQEWRDAVVKLVDAARLVVVVTGDGEGLAWEIDQWCVLVDALGAPFTAATARNGDGERGCDLSRGGFHRRHVVERSPKGQ